MTGELRDTFRRLRKHPPVAELGQGGIGDNLLMRALTN